MKLNNCVCDTCQNECYQKPSQSALYNKHYCSNNCKNLGALKGKVVKCSTCQVEFYKSKSKLNSKRHYCSIECSPRRKKGNFIKRYRSKALEHYGNKCQNKDCPILKYNIPMDDRLLDVDHINSNRQDCRLKNLQILCILCHVLKTRKKKEIIQS